MSKVLPFHATANFLWYGSRRTEEFNCQSKSSAIKHIRAKYHGALDIWVQVVRNYPEAEQLSLF